MNDLLTITVDDIKALDDDVLEELIAELCRCEFLYHDLHTAAIIAGGELTSTDGGIDILVSLGSELPYTDGFIPRSVTGFQVKKHTMPAGKIEEEMKPGGELRPSIQKIAVAGGSYIIVSGKDNVSGSWREKRINAMHEALGDIVCHVDFYGCDRVARWVREYPAMVTWVRQHAGRPLTGWQSFGDWTGSGSLDESPFIIDDKTILRSLPKHEEVRGVAALEKIRDRIMKSKSVTRIIGLSGVGKTRFIQALFEGGIGNYVSLPRESVIYTDNSEALMPLPSSMLEEAARTNARTVIIVDNCTSKVHRHLTNKLTKVGGDISLVTVEHEIKDSLPEDTIVFKLEPGSEETLRQVVGLRFPKYERTKVERIVRCAGGNFRIAVALAKGVGENFDVSKITDDELFDRIFYQNGVRRELITDVAQVLSLLYSFNFEDLEDNSELAKLGSLRGLTVDDMHDGVRYLESKDLIQARGKWRAVLPHALANRLAERSLIRLRPNKVRELVEHPDNKRMMKSFANRIGFLKGDSSVEKIVGRWLEPDGYLHNIFAYDAERTKVLKNAAIVEEDLVLQTIEAWTADENVIIWIKRNYQQDGILQTVAYLGYAPSLFYRVLAVLMKWYSLEEDLRRKDNQKRTIAKFFQLYLSGTTIAPEDRREILTSWLDEQNFDEDLLKACLQGYLEIGRVNGHPDFDREKARGSTGYRPRTNKEVIEWYDAGLEILRSYAVKNSHRSVLANELFLDNFSLYWRANWLNDGMESFIQDRITEDRWKSGLLTVTRLLQWPKSKLSADRRRRLEEIREQISPKSLREKIETYVLFDQNDTLRIVNSLGDTKSDGVLEIIDLAKSLGNALGGDLDLLEELLPDLLKVLNYYSSTPLGQGLARVESNRGEVIKLLIEKLRELTEPEIGDYRFAKGIVGELFDIDLLAYHKLMDQVVNDDDLRCHAMSLQASHVQDERDVKRLDGLIGDPRLSMRSYTELCFCLAGIPDEALQRYLEKIASLSHEGIATAIAIASKVVERKTELPVGLLKTVIEVSSKYVFERSKSMQYRHAATWLITIIEKAFNDHHSFEATSILLQSLKEVNKNRISLSDGAEMLLGPISQRQPEAMLDVFVSEVDTSKSWEKGEGFPYSIREIITVLPYGRVAEWGRIEPQKKLTELSYCITPFDGKYEGGVLSEWSALVEFILSKVEDPKFAINYFDASLECNNEWGTDLAEKLSQLFPSLLALESSTNPATRDWASAKRADLNIRIEEAKKSRFDFHREVEEPRFE